MQLCPDLGHRVSLQKLLPDALFNDAEEICAAACCCDSRNVEPGDLFVAIEGPRNDGHDFINEAVVRGCSAVVAARPIPHAGVPVCVVDNARDAFARICQALAGNPSHQMKVIGITGTNGKTTTSCLLAGVLTEAGRKVGLSGTLGYFDGEKVEDPTLTTPPANQLAAWLKRTQANGCSHAVLEVSSHALDQSRVGGIRFDAACVTNVSRDHLDYHPTIDDYRFTKSKLLDNLPAEGLAVINADDPTSAGYLNRISGPVLTVGIRSAAEITGTPIEQCTSEQTFLLTAGSETVPVRTTMIGVHHIYNCLTAAAVGLAYGINLDTIARGLESAGHVPGRLERIECGQPFGVFVDYAHTPDALSGTLRALAEVVSGRLICVFGAGGDRDRDKRPLMGRAAEDEANLTIVTSDNPRTEDPSAIIGDILAGFRDANRAEVCTDRSQAIHRALATAQPGDCVLIAGKGHEKHQIIGDEIIPIDDCQIAKQWLYDVKPFAA
jgi:UDP-N-acetylmuramoyl-L-alanyl-D-glutamate--2,6-diaminopimelate ligase